MPSTTLIVGAGPVGLILAAELARFGVKPRLIDQASERTDKSKALVLWSRTLELLDRSGCGDRFVKAGFKVRAADIIANGKQIARVDLDQLETPHPYALMLPQSETERLLDEHLQSYKVQIERQVSLIGFSQNSQQVAVQLKHADGRVEEAVVDWLIGCDGAHSAVRHGLNAAFEGDTLPSTWVLADVHLDHRQTPPDELSLYWHAAGMVAIFPLSADRFRVIADIGDQADPNRKHDPDLAEIQALLDERCPGNITAHDPVWLSSFNINERKVRDYRAGRVFLAGDAAHVHSPAGGQGMNTGMQDAINLAWKLALVVQGRAAPQPLLDSYSTERSEVGRMVLKNAGRLTQVALMRGSVTQSIRNHLAMLVFGLPPLRHAMARALAEVAIGYPHSPLTHRPAHAPAGPAPGERAPVTASPAEVETLPRFTVCAESSSAIAELIHRNADLLDNRLRPPISSDGVWLVRPDGYVSTAVKKTDIAEIDSFLNQWRANPAAI